MTKRILNFFDKLEDKMRAKLSRLPMIYAFLGGVGVVLFWRGVWHFADDIHLNPILSIIIGSIILLIIGAFVSTFIGSRLILSGLSGEKKLTEKTKSEIDTEETEIRKLQSTLDRVEKEVKTIQSEVEK
ncbi:MAG: hypothetical protein HY507_01300 [Candidatus Zambryskibacteria bacterium]|nr:hypothetical protein [Candidatus Zambryskibacteria bacterium]